MSREVIARVNRHEELVLELVQERFTRHWANAISAAIHDDPDDAAYAKGWNAAWDEASERLNDIIEAYIEGNDHKMLRWDR